MPEFHKEAAPTKHGTEFATPPPPLPRRRDFPPSFQGCGIRLLSTFPHITAAHPFVGCPASTCRATRQITDGECERDEKDGSGLVGTHSGHRRVNIGQRRIRRVDPTHLRPPPINH